MSPRFLTSLLTSAALLGALSSLAACANEPTAAPAREAAPIPTSGPAAPPSPVYPFPALERPGTIYNEDDDLHEAYVRSHGGRLDSRYVLYTDGTFELQFSSFRFGPFAYSGRYTQADARVTFDWDGWSLAGPWGATGTLKGDRLSVEYNLVMQLTDFVGGVYVRAP